MSETIALDPAGAAKPPAEPPVRIEVRDWHDGPDYVCSSCLAGRRGDSAGRSRAWAERHVAELHAGASIAYRSVPTP